MNTIAFAPQQEVAGGHPRVVPQPAARPAAPVAQPAAAPRADRVQMNGDVNPYEGFADDFTRVTVDRWRKGPNDSIEHILRNQGYSSNEIYKKDKNGQSLIQRVAAANGLKDPNLIRPGQKGLMVPVKDKPEAKAEVPKPVVEQPKPEAPEPVGEEPGSEAPKPPVAEESKPEAPQAEEPASAKPKKRHRFLWFGKKDKPEAPAQPPQANQPATPAAENPPAPSSEPGTDPASIAAAEASEVNMLMKGVTDGKFNRNEFMALNATANQYTELRSQYAKDGFKPEQMVELSQVQQQYGSMYARFLADDKAKVTFAGGDSPDPAARFRAQQNEQGGQFYDQFVNHQIDEATIKARLLAQRQAASQK
ncbi:MAG: hypothetical protein KF760_35075 [Candidatus Eremiobacteraeota bacterium]|nr:hypothetical protein [Candidatus Eremiobacteraeota bacterium]MCW5870860.1 hypothetical protein [Candidatus Eremiobacteraeota bacterium]